MDFHFGRHEFQSAGSSRNGWCCGWWRGSAWQPCGARDVQYWGTDSLWRGAAQTTRQHTEMGCKMQMSIQPSVWDCIPGCHRIWSSIDPKRTKHTYSSCWYWDSIPPNQSFWCFFGQNRILSHEILAPKHRQMKTLHSKNKDIRSSRTLGLDLCHIKRFHCALPLVRCGTLQS